MLDHALARWNLTPDGTPLATATSLLLPVRQSFAGSARPAMLKVSDEPHEARAMPLMRWWNGDGAAHIFAHEVFAQEAFTDPAFTDPAAGDSAGALLMERAEAPGALLALARHDDAAATRIICAVATRLHRPRGPLPAGLVPLDGWFAPLLAIGPGQGGLLARAAGIAERLLADPREIAPLHGDLHHENILDFGPSDERPAIPGRAGDWRAIDPKGLLGERGFDLAILFCDPDLGRPEIELARRPDIFARRLATVAEETGIAHTRLLDWILAWTGLSWSWAVEDGVDAPIERAIAGFAAAARDR
ncbi:hypothetical protein KHC19_00415 [Ancylobacter oerskovii]|nr:hypothetical protein [Ancylobacter oerskovii]